MVLARQVVDAGGGVEVADQLPARGLVLAVTVPVEQVRRARQRRGGPVAVVRASIPVDQNTGALAPFGRTGGFVWYNRILDGDAFWVATPGFDHCTAADITCVMQKNVS